MQVDERQKLAGDGQLGVARTCPVYAAQIALYQAYLEDSVPTLSRHSVLLTSINKDKAQLWFKLVPFDAALAQRMSDRAERAKLSAVNAPTGSAKYKWTPGQGALYLV